MAASALGTLICSCVCFIFFFNRKRPLIKAAQPVFLCTTCIAAAVLNASNFLRIGTPTFAICQARLWVAHLSFTVLFGTLVAKLWRVYQLFGKEQSAMKRIKVTARQAMQVIGLFVFLDIVILGSWTAVAPYKPTAVEFTYDLDQYGGEERGEADKAYLWECQTDPFYSDYFNNSALAAHVVLVASGVYFAYMCRNVSKKLAEKSEIVFTVYLSSMLAFLSFVVVKPKVVPQEIKLVFVSIVTLFGTSGGCCAFLIPKLRQGLDTVVSTEDFKRKSLKKGRSGTGGMSARAGVAMTVVRGSGGNRSSAGVNTASGGVAEASEIRNSTGRDTAASTETVFTPAPGTTRGFATSIWAERSNAGSRADVEMGEIASEFVEENPMRTPSRGESGLGAGGGRRTSQVRFEEGTRPGATVTAGTLGRTASGSARANI